MADQDPVPTSRMVPTRPPTQDEVISSFIGDMVKTVAEQVGRANVEEARIKANVKGKELEAAAKSHLLAAIVGVVVLVLVFAFAGYLIHYGGPGAALASDVVKIGLGLLAGGVGGFGLGRHSDKS